MGGPIFGSFFNEDQFFSNHKAEGLVGFKNGQDVAGEEVICDVGGDACLVGDEGACVAFAHFGGDFEADVDELAKLGVVVCAGGIVA
jgi:hypothetical protein